MAARCRRCGLLHLPPHPLCRECGSTSMEWAEMGGAGKLATFTAIAVGPSFMVAAGYNRNNPYVSGIVTLLEGPSISARILGVDATRPEGILVGMPLKVEFLEVGEGAGTRTVLAFRATPS